MTRPRQRFAAFCVKLSWPSSEEVAMKAFYVANNPGVSLTSADPRRLVCVIPDLEPGNYIVFAKASVGTNVHSGYPPPAYPYGSGVLTLAFAGATDLAYCGVLPDSGQNNESYSLMVAASSEGIARARLYFQALYPLRIVAYYARIAAF